MAFEAEVIKDLESLKRQGNTEGTEIKEFSFNDETIRIRGIACSITAFTADGSTLIFDSREYGLWDDFYWSGDDDMDGYAGSTLLRITSPNNTFYEFFNDEGFKGD